MKIFAGYDKREAQGFQVFTRSLIENTQEDISIHPIGGHQGDGTNAFTYSRFNVPVLCNYEGWAIFMDGSDMMMRDDIGKLWDFQDDKYAVMVVKHDYKTKHARKYVGTPMEAKNEDYPRKNWSSLILWNCAHPRNRIVGHVAPWLHRFEWLSDDLIGEIPNEWNHLVSEYDENPDAKVAHYTIGIPGFHEYRNAEFAPEWRGWL